MKHASRMGTPSDTLGIRLRTDPRIGGAIVEGWKAISGYSTRAWQEFFPHREAAEQFIAREYPGSPRLRGDRAAQRVGSRATGARAAATNRWGRRFTQGTKVWWHLARGGFGGPGYYLRLAKADDFSRAYGRQARIWVGGSWPPRSSVSGEDNPNVREIGLDDLVVEADWRRWGKTPPGGW